MISYIKGELVLIGENSITIDNCGIGYNIFVSPKTIKDLPHINNEIKIYTFMNVKEDGINLFGFINMEEVNMFYLLISVQGIGPKTALAILAVLSPAQIALAVASNDIKTISIGKGVGKKAAERIALELRDKVNKLVDSPQANEVFTLPSSNKNDALAGLMVLGYSNKEATTAIDNIYKPDMTSEELIKQALKALYR